MPRLTELRCTWQGMAGYHRPCGCLARVALGPWSAYRWLRENGWGFIHDERPNFGVLDPERPRFVILCSACHAQWLLGWGTRYEVAPARAIEWIREANATRQQPLFADEPERASVGAIHSGDDGNG